jgi:hypothetical protein
MNLWVTENIDDIIAAIVVYLIVSFFLILIFTLYINRVSFIRSLFKIVQRLLFMLLYPILLITALSTVALIPVIVCLIFGHVFSFSGFIIDAFFILVLLVLAFIIAVGVVFRLPMTAKEQQDTIQYEKYGVLSSWGALTRAYHKRIGWTPMVAKRIAPLLEQIQKPEIRMLAPAANCGEEERDLAQLLSAHIHKRFLVTLCDINEMRHIETQDDGRVSISYHTMNAFDLPKFLTQTQDVIYDPKGILWFPRGKEAELIERLRLFYDLLDDQGMVIVDAAIGSGWKVFINDLRMTYNLPLTFYAEVSTYSYINRFFTPGSVASSLFTLTLVDGLDGPYGMAVLKKVPNRLIE